MEIWRVIVRIIPLLMPSLFTYFDKTARMVNEGKKFINENEFFTIL